MKRLFIKRLYRRLKFAFRFKEMYTWEYESCNLCGINYRLPIGIVDKTWLAVNGKSEGCLCVNCFLQLAQEKGIEITIDDIERLYVFNPDANCFYIIE